MRLLFLFLVLFTCNGTAVFAQKITKDSIKSIKADASFDNIKVVPMYSDDNSSTFVIFVKRSVPLHKHVYHVMLHITGYSEF